MGNLESAGLTTGSIVFIVSLVVVIVLAAVLLWKYFTADMYNKQVDYAMAAAIPTAAALIMIAIFLTWGIHKGFNTHYATEYVGTVTLGERVQFEQKFVGDDTLYDFNDLRVYTYEGKKLDVRCTPKHVRYGVDKNICTVTKVWN